ncbi:hypothetical protein L2E81_21985 [Planktothrix agardhii 1033]|nr:hypothetical protein [Planktothrix agardhii 1033]
MFSKIIVTPDQIALYREQLADNQEALAALDVLEKCEGDLEFAAETIAIETGELQDNLGDEDPNEPSWLEKLVEKLRPHICTPAFKDAWNQGLSTVMGLLIPVVGYSGLLILIIIYISKKNLDDFCKDC